jgi:preprotein translocase subunit SecA
MEAKENVEVKSENQTLASITVQNYFKLYNKLSGMTGTADTEAEEFMKIYNLEVTVIPTNEPVNRLDEADVIYKNKAGKYNAVIKLLDDLNKKGQPALVGTIAIEDSEKLSSMLTKHKIPHEVLNAKQHEREALIIAQAGQKGAVTIATNMAGRGTDIKLSDETKKLGGLFIVGTERHEARRIDNQLRGRSGRQGDPGKSKFFLSLEDDLMRIFGSDRISKFMGRLGMKDDEPIEHKMITNAIARAQKKVETHNFEIRKHLLEFDNVMNEQRKLIYKIRRDILSDAENMELIQGMIEDVCSFIIDANEPERKASLESWPWPELQKSFNTTFNTKEGFDVVTCQQKYQGDLLNYFYTTAFENLRKKFNRYDELQVKVAIREILLSIFDQFWKDHLLSMDHLKEGINLRAYAQKDPLNEYKRESFELFEKMRSSVKKAVVETIFTIQLYTPEEVEQLKKRQQAELEASLRAHQNAQKNEKGGEIRRSTNKVGRNDPCPCGSGKKYKHCHGT